jgi:hypothetical protein
MLLTTIIYTGAADLRFFGLLAQKTFTRGDKNAVFCRVFDAWDRVLQLTPESVPGLRWRF